MKWLERLKPNQLLSKTVTTPRVPTVAIHTKASGSPAKMASTPEALETTLRSRLWGEAETTAAANQRPSRAGPSEVHKARIRLLLSASRYWAWLKIAEKFERVRRFESVVSAPCTTTYSGRPRNTATKSRNGSIPSHAALPAPRRRRATVRPLPGDGRIPRRRGAAGSVTAPNACEVLIAYFQPAAMTLAALARSALVGNCATLWMGGSFA